MAALPAQLALGQIPTLGAFDIALNTINTSPYIIGSMMLMMNLGARFLSLEITKNQEKFLSHPWVRRFLIFVVFFIGTRNVWVAFWMALIVILLIGYLFNENSSLCLFRGGLPGSACKVEGFDTTHMAAEGSHGSKPQQQSVGLTPEEQEILQKLLAKQQRLVAPTSPPETQLQPDLYKVYQRNLNRIKEMF